SRWAEVLEASDLVHGPEDEGDRLLPLVWDSGRLYLHRLHHHEISVAQDLTVRGGSSSGRELAPSTLALLDRLFPPPPDGRPDQQRRAAEMALSHPVTVIAGGPGTGKTRTIARLLAAALGDPSTGVGTVALAAPTGKAAARMTEAVGSAVE